MAKRLPPIFALVSLAKRALRVFAGVHVDQYAGIAVKIVREQCFQSLGRFMGLIQA